MPLAFATMFMVIKDKVERDTIRSMTPEERWLYDEWTDHQRKLEIAKASRTTLASFLGLD